MAALIFLVFPLMEFDSILINPLNLLVHIPVISQTCKETAWYSTSTGLKVRGADFRPPSSTNYLECGKSLYFCEHPVHVLYSIELYHF